MIVEVHHHDALETRYPGSQDFPAELVDAMAQNGISSPCLNRLGPQFDNHGNDAVLKAVKRFPARIIGIGPMPRRRFGRTLHFRDGNYAPQKQSENWAVDFSPERAIAGGRGSASATNN